MKQIYSLFTCYLFGFNLIDVEGYPLLSENYNESVAAHLGFNSFYITILVILGLSATFLAGCLCCKRKKGFQEFSSQTRSTARSNIEFANPLSTVNTQSEITLFPPSGATPITFDPLPPLTPKHQQVPALNPRPAAFTDALTKGISVQAWFQEPQDDFPRQQLHYLRECGRGWFGRVVEGEARGILPNGRTSRVIVRILREGASDSEQKFFLHEARPYMELSHPNILRLLGRCLENDPFLLLFEACNGGDLKSWLSQNIASRETLTQQGITLRMAADIATGLAHMNHHGFVHTDLAARNVLVTSDLRIKVGDYGTSFETFKDDYYCLDVVALPIRWCAPESLLCTDTTIETKEVTAPANVWSFGVVLWEICEFGKLPYTNLSDDQVIVQVLGSEKVRLPEPSFPSPFKNHLYYLMQLCWRNHKERPSISHILSMLNHLLTSKIKTPNDMDDFERRWENMKPNTVPKTDNHTPTISEDRVKSDNDSGVVMDNKHSAFTGSEMDLSSKKLLAESSSSMTISPQLSVSSSGGEFFSQTSSPIKLKSPSLQNLQGSLEDINEGKGIDRSVEDVRMDKWLQNIEIKNEKDAKLVSGVYKAINDLDTALSLEKTSSSNESSYDSPSTNRRLSGITSANPVPEFKLGPFVNSNFLMDRRLKFPPDSFQDDSFLMRRTGDSSGTDTEDEIWRRKIERGEFSEKVKEKSKSIADLMVLTHIDNSDGSESDSLPSFSFNKIVRQNTKANALTSSIAFGSDKCIYSSLTAEQSDSDLKKFQNALKKKDMDDPSLNFLRRDSLTYFINNPNFKFSDLSSTNSSNFHQTDHFLEIRASEKTNSSKITSKNQSTEPLIPIKSMPEDEVSVSSKPISPATTSVVLDSESEIPSTTSMTDVINLTNHLSSEISDDDVLKKSSNGQPCHVEEHTAMILDENGRSNVHYDALLGNCKQEQDNPTINSALANKMSPGISHHNESSGKEKIIDTLDSWNLTVEELKPDFIINSTIKDDVVKTSDRNKSSHYNLNEEEPDSNFGSWNTHPCTEKKGAQDKEQRQETSDVNTDSEKEGSKLKIIDFELGDSGIIFDESSENTQFILPVSLETNLENTVILGSCEDFTLGLYKGLKTNSGNELNSEQDNEDGDEKGIVLEWNRKNKLDGKSVHENHLELKNRDLDENCDKIYIETVDNCDFVPETMGDYTYNRFYEDQSDDTYLDSGKSSDVLDDDNYELRPYTSYNNLADQSYFSQELQEGEDCSNERRQYFAKHIDRSNTSRSPGVSTEDLALKALTPDDEKSSDTGFRDKSSPSESCDDMYNNKYNLEDIENELKDSQRTSPIESLELNPQHEIQVHDSCEIRKSGVNNSFMSENGLRKEPFSYHCDENVEIVKNNLQSMPNYNANDNNIVDKLQSLNKEDDRTATEDAPRIEEDEKPPPSYEEYERLHGKFQPFKLNRNSYDFESSFCTNEDDRLRLSLEKCHSASSSDSEEERQQDRIHEGGQGWYLHSRNPQHLESVDSSWLPEEITDDNDRGEAVNEEYLMAIRNELNEKLLKMHLPGLNSEEEEESTHDDLIICEDFESKRNPRKATNIFIQYSNFSDYLSPIAEEDENRCSSSSSSISDTSDISRTLSLHDTEKEGIDYESAPAYTPALQECQELTTIFPDSSETQILKNSGLKSQQLNPSYSLELTTDQLENADPYSEYSVGSITPVTGSPSATNPNATFSSLNESLSEVFLSPNSAQSDLNFTDDKTIHSSSDEDSGTDIETDECPLSPSKESEAIQEQSNFTKNVNELLLQSSCILNDERESKNSVEGSQPHNGKTCASLNCNETKLSETVFTPQNSDTSNVADEMKGSASNYSLNHNSLISSHSEPRTSETLSLSSTIKNQVELSSTLAFEDSVTEVNIKPPTHNNNSLIGGSEDGDPDQDPKENYKNYCRKKFKITKVDESIKPTLSEDFGKKVNEFSSDQKIIVDNAELNRRLNEINRVAHGRLEINLPTSEVSVPLPSPSDQNDCLHPSSWLVLPKLSDLKNLEKLSVSEANNNDDQMMSTSFIDSNSAENSDIEETLDSDNNWNEESRVTDSKAVIDDGDFWCGSSELNAALNHIVQEEDSVEKDDDYDDEDDEDTAEFVPSSWNSQATPIKSALKSPEMKSEPKKSVSFKRQRYHCVYEYPREEHSDSEEASWENNSRFSPLINFDFSEYTDWEMGVSDDGLSVESSQESETEIVKPSEKHNVYALTPIDKDFSFNPSLDDDEFFISSSTRPFKNDQVSLNCQFFPGKTYLDDNFTPLAADIGEESKIEKEL
nr:PREDICTED: uncharacterized protein LOC109043959 [Bemisia tabaci]